MSFQKWKFPQIQKQLVRELAAESGHSEFLCALLAARGYTTAENIGSFFDAGEEQLEDPFILKDMDLAVERIQRAVEEGEMIAIYGDYDADGVTATVVLFTYLESIGADVRYYIPTRDGEGYGLNRDAIAKIHEMGITLMITVDNGITAVEEVDYAASLGIDIVITDHHRPKDELPRAVAVVDPHREDCPFAFKGLAGVGVAFKLVCALEGDSQTMLDLYSEIVTIGTIADVMPMSGENRVIVSRGLSEFSQTQNVGLKALMEVSGIGDKPITAESVAFTLVPRINAAGRLGRAKKAVDLLTTEDEEYACTLAQEIDEQNRERKAIEQQIGQDIQQMIEQNPSLLKDRVLVLAGEGWNHGVVGIAAAKITEKYGKPCFLISIEKNGQARGSARSVGDFSLFDALKACSHLLIRFGGHTQAAGLTLEADKIDLFRREVQQYAAQAFRYMPVSELRIDHILTPDQITLDQVKEQAKLEPFGQGNEVPVYAVQSVQIGGVYPVSGGKHLRLRLNGKKSAVYAMRFGVSETEFPYREGDLVDVAMTLSVSHYNGEERLSAIVKEIRPCGLREDRLFDAHQVYEMIRRKESLTQQEKADALVTREDLATVYRYLRSVGTFAFDYDLLFSKFNQTTLDYCKVRLCTDILNEMGLITKQKSELRPEITVCPNPAKVDLEQSRILQYIREKI